MLNQKGLRKIFQITALILFIIQFKQSVRKYFQAPVVVQESRVPVKDLPPPIIYVCNTNQFNFTIARNHGYKTISRFIAGILTNDSNISWNGKDRNLSFKYLESVIFDYNHDTLDLLIKQESPNKWTKEINVQNTFLFPYGACKMIKDLKPKVHVRIFSKKKVYLLLVDPSKGNDIRTGETIDAIATIGPSSATHFEMGMFEIEYDIYDSSIHDGTSCTDYEKLDTSYGECLKKMLLQELQSAYGCIPPWVNANKSHQACDKEKEINAAAIKKNLIYSELGELIGNKEPDMFKKCLSPCISMKIKHQKVMHWTNRLEKAFLEAKSQDWATVHKQVYSYDIFSLTVDLGSALGLWMGFSILSILDHILINWIKFSDILNQIITE